MEATSNALDRAYHLLMHEWPDPRTQPLPLVTRPLVVLGIMGTYTLFVKRIGPYLMRNRKPFQLKNTLIVYNALQIAFNLYLFWGLTKFWFGTYNWQCEPIDLSSSPGAMEMIRLIYLYFWLKIVDLLDTVFFVLRKKDNQITFLHVYHHSMMVLLSWIGLTYFPGGHSTFLGFINVFVHAVMYTYYLVSALNPNTIWWKKHVTHVQLFQHCIVLVHEAQLLVHNPCGYPMFPPVMLVPQAVLLIVLFMRFYWRAYGEPAVTTPTAKGTVTATASAATTAARAARPKAA